MKKAKDESQDAAEIEKAVAGLSQNLQKIGEAIYKNVGSSPAGGGASPDAGKPEGGEPKDVKSEDVDGKK